MQMLQFSRKQICEHAGPQQHPLLQKWVEAVTMDPPANFQTARNSVAQPQRCDVRAGDHAACAGKQLGVAVKGLPGPSAASEGREAEKRLRLLAKGRNSEAWCVA